MAAASGNYDARPSGDYSAEAPLTEAQIAPAMKELSRGFASIFPGKTVDDLTTATKWTHEAIRAVVDFVPPKGGGEKEKAASKKNEADLLTLKNLTKALSKNGKGMDQKELHGILKNFDTMQDVVKNIQKELVANPKELQALLKADDKLKEFLVKQMNAALDTRYKGKGFTKEMTGKAAKKQFTAELNNRNQKVLQALKAPLQALRAAAPAPSVPAAMQANRDKLAPLQLPQSAVTLKPEVAGTPESASRSAATTPLASPTSPATPITGSPLSSPTSSSAGSASVSPTSAAASPVVAKLKAAIEHACVEYLVDIDLIGQLQKQKSMMKTLIKQIEIDRSIEQLKEHIKKLQGDLFKDVTDVSVLKNRLNNYYDELTKKGTSEERKEVCKFLIEAIDKRLIGLEKT